MYRWERDTGPPCQINCPQNMLRQIIWPLVNFYFLITQYFQRAVSLTGKKETLVDENMTKLASR